MASIKKKRLSWNPPTDVDVVAHMVYVGTGEEFTSGIRVDMPRTSLVLPDDFPPGTFAEDVNYTVGIAAVDDVGNEGDMAIVANPFDFVAPGVPTNLIVEDI